ncbi:MAG: threonine synthase [Pseudomonadota bacterium]|nr:threonine synthase [Pseudomonadota bacterium]
MEYISTRGFGPVSFERTILDGLAPDGGLYVPTHYPKIPFDKMEELTYLSYEEVAEVIMSPFIGNSIPRETFRRMLKKAYANFADEDVAPLNQLGDDTWLLELYHGPTLAFKDIALQLLGQMIDYTLDNNDVNATVIGATSGDTGPAAIEGLKHVERAKTFMLFPKNRTSAIQQRQMTTCEAKNVFPIAIEGTFDDCQDIVKALFNQEDFKEKVNATAVNSISWARILPQVVYYFFAWSRLRTFIQDKRLSFSVPTGNFGDIYAGYVAMQCGLPVERLVIANNSNDILTRFITEGDYSMKKVQPTSSPSMDILVASNFERFLFDLYGKMPERTKSAMEEFRQSGSLEDINSQELEDARSIFDAFSATEIDVLKQMSSSDILRQITIDPHTAVGMCAAEAKPGLKPMVVLSTAHPAKFPSAVERATGAIPILPSHMEDLMDKEEIYETLPNDVEVVKKYILERYR